MATRIVVGLGNPGPDYEATRHNVGYAVVDRLADRHGLGWKLRGNRLEARGRIDGTPVALVKPVTFMNRSGEALAALRRAEPFELDELLVCYDELALPLGRLRLRPGGSDAGHNGVRSLIDRLGGQAFPRLRVGIAPLSGSVRDGAAFVLRGFRRGERSTIADAIERAADAVEVTLGEGLEAAMNRYNAAED